MNSPLSMLALFCSAVAVVLYWSAVGLLSLGYGRPDTQGMPFALAAMVCWAALALFGACGLLLSAGALAKGGARRIAALALGLSVFSLGSAYHRWLRKTLPVSAPWTRNASNERPYVKAERGAAEAHFRKRLADEWHNELSLAFDQCQVKGPNTEATCAAVATEITVLAGDGGSFYLRVRAQVRDRFSWRANAQAAPVSTSSTTTLVFDGSVAPSQRYSFEGIVQGTVSQAMETGETRIVPVQGDFSFTGESLTGSLAFILPEVAGRSAGQYRLTMLKKPDVPAK